MKFAATNTHLLYRELSKMKYHVNNMYQNITVHVWAFVTDLLTMQDLRVSRR